MLIQNEFVDVKGKAGAVRCAVARPSAAGRFPLLLCFGDIFGNTEPHLRVMRRLAGHGYVVVSPEPWARFLPTGTVLDFDKDRQNALDAQAKGDGAAADADRRSVIEHFKQLPHVADAVFASGFCYGGHLAFRAALDADVKATACFYGTGIHADKLGGGAVDSLARATAPNSGIKGSLLLVWGRNDPHIPAAGRARIHAALDEAGVRWEPRLYDADHAFARDVGPRYDPGATDLAIAEALKIF
ncbi:MAG: dienelactone hydrolase family protein [Deltaproteobacteria bacterium]|nr:dienelactone hydrolase family protein [Deltaproteobacteria bacterium]